jgi:hypothetical protein
LTGAHQFLVYANDVDLLHENINVTRKNTEALLDDSKRIAVQVNTDKTKYMVMTRQQNAKEKNHNLSMTIKSLEKCDEVQVFCNDS